jgi:hypothetical protein
VGAKRETRSYRRIAEIIGVPPQHLLFLSDVRAELDAARRAGYQTVWLVRDGLPSLAAAHRRATRFDQIPLGSRMLRGVKGGEKRPIMPSTRAPNPAPIVARPAGFAACYRCG